MPAVPRGLGVLTHNPLLLYYTESTERTINPLYTPKSASSYLHKDIKETEGEQRIYTLQCASTPWLLNNFPPLTCFSLNFSPVAKQRRSPESSLRVCLYNSMGIDLFKVANRLIYQQGQNTY